MTSPRDPLTPEAREHARRAGAAAPPITPAQARRLAQLLMGGGERA
ncbi:hypothetical protein V3N95_07640 [Micrococcaceae bacterium Sec6.3]